MLKTKIKQIITLSALCYLVLIHTLYFGEIAINETIKYLSPMIPQAIAQKAMVGQMSDKLSVLEENLDNYTWTKKQWENAGAKWEEVWAVIQAESTWQQEAWNCNTNQTLDIGLYQLNLYYHDISPACAIDLKCSTKEAIKIWKEQGWTPWYGAKKLNL